MFKRIIINKIQCIGKHGHGERNLRLKRKKKTTSNGFSRVETATPEVYEINNRLDMRAEKV